MHNAIVLVLSKICDFDVLHFRYRNECEYQEQLRSTLEQLNKVRLFFIKLGLESILLKHN